MPTTRTRRTGPRPQAGFTIVEVLVVLLILGLIVNSAYQVYNSSVDNARYHTMRSQVALMRKAIEQYHATSGNWPPSLEALTQKYMNRVPDDPLTGTEGNDWMVIGPGSDRSDLSTGTWWPAKDLSSIPPTHPLTRGIYDVRSSTGI